MGEEHITEELDGLKFRIGPKSFYQTNTRQALHLYNIARQFAGLPERRLSMIFTPVQAQLPIL